MHKSTKSKISIKKFENVEIFSGKKTSYTLRRVSAEHFVKLHIIIATFIMYQI